MERGRHLAWFFIDNHSQDAARLMERLEPGDVAALLYEAPLRLATKLFLEMAPSTGASCLAVLEPFRAGEVLEELPAEIASGLLRPLDLGARTRILESVAPEVAQILITLLSYADETAGALMDTAALTISRDSTVGDGRDLVRRHARQTLYYIYVVGDDRRLMGVVTMRQLLLAPSGDPIASIMRSNPDALPADADRIAILAHPGWRRVHALPVVDQQGAMLGVVRYETFRRLEDDAAAVYRARGLQRAALELGEIYWLSIGRLVASLGGTLAQRPRPEQQRGAGHDS